MGEYLDFRLISEKITFKELFDHMHIGYKEKEKELWSRDGIVNIEKNLYINPSNQTQKGSVINFYANHHEISLREAASYLNKIFITKEYEKIPEYQLLYHKFLVEQGINEAEAREWELGYVKDGMLRGKIAIKIRDEAGNTAGWIGRSVDKDAKSQYFFPKNLKVGNHVYNLHRVKIGMVILTVSPFDVIHLSQMGYNNVIGLITCQMTEAQENLLKRYTQIFILHPEPECLVKRLSQFAFVKAPAIDEVKGLNRDDVLTLF